MVTESKSIFTDKFVNITYDEVNKIVIAKWMGFLKLEDLKTGCVHLNSFVKRNNVKKHLSDQTQLKVLSKEVQACLATEVLPQLEKDGLEKLAVLVSDDVFAKATVDNVNNNMAKIGKLSIATFNAKKDCTDWLNQ